MNERLVCFSAYIAGTVLNTGTQFLYLINLIGLKRFWHVEAISKDAYPGFIKYSNDKRYKCFQILYYLNPEFCLYNILYDSQMKERLFP